MRRDSDSEGEWARKKEIERGMERGGKEREKGRESEKERIKVESRY